MVKQSFRKIKLYYSRNMSYMNKKYNKYVKISKNVNVDVMNAMDVILPFYPFPSIIYDIYDINDIYHIPDFRLPCSLFN